MPLPSGIICMWAGAIVNIPAGWNLCDGTAGTPDLRNRFIVGAGDLYNPGAAGGTYTHNHTLTTDGHYHSFDPGDDIAEGTDIFTYTTVDTDTATTNQKPHLPPYYSLAFIQKA